MEVAVIGTGMFPFGLHPDKTIEEMSYHALQEALSEASIEPGQVELAYFSNVLGARLWGRQTLGQELFDLIGIKGIPVVNVENACASGSTAIHEAALSIHHGRIDVAIVLGVEKLTGSGLRVIQQGDQELETRLGFSMPGMFAMKAKRYFHEYGGNEKKLAEVSVKNYFHASLNPMAMFQKQVTAEEVLNSPMIADPLTRMQCCPMPDGAACVILASRQFARKHTNKPVYLKSSVLVSGEYKNPPNLSFWESDRRASDQAYKLASVGPEDIDLVETHDAFTISEVMHYEGLGFCSPGEGLSLLETGSTRIGGQIPFNSSGGLIGRGHALGATGVAQTIEIVHQLQNRAGKRQVDQVRIGLAHCMGADKGGDARATTVQIYGIS